MTAMLSHGHIRSRVIGRTALGVALAAGLGSSALAQESASFISARDTTLFESPTGATGSGLGDEMFAGSTLRNGLRRSLLFFDLSSLPDGSVITSATLTLYQTRNQAGDSTVSLHRVRRNWGSGNSNSPQGGGSPAQANDATWIHAFFPGPSTPSQLWSTPGGDFIATASASAPGIFNTNEFFNITSASLVSDLNSWVANPANNFGWMIRSDEGPSIGARAFATREWANASQRPKLSVTYIPAPGAAASLAMVLMFASRRKRSA